MTGPGQSCPTAPHTLPAPTDSEFLANHPYSPFIDHKGVPGTRRSRVFDAPTMKQALHRRASWLQPMYKVPTARCSRLGRCTRTLAPPTNLTWRRPLLESLHQIWAVGPVTPVVLVRPSRPTHFSDPTLHCRIAIRRHDGANPRGWSPRVKTILTMPHRCRGVPVR